MIDYHFGDDWIRQRQRVETPAEQDKRLRIIRAPVGWDASQPIECNHQQPIRVKQAARIDCDMTRCVHRVVEYVHRIVENRGLNATWVPVEYLAQFRCADGYVVVSADVELRVRE